MKYVICLGLAIVGFVLTLISSVPLMILGFILIASSFGYAQLLVTALPSGCLDCGDIKPIPQWMQDVLFFDKEEDGLAKAEEWRESLTDLAELRVPGSCELLKEVDVLIGLILEQREKVKRYPYNDPEIIHRLNPETFVLEKVEV